MGLPSGDHDLLFKVTGVNIENPCKRYNFPKSTAGTVFVLIWPDTEVE